MAVVGAIYTLRRTPHGLEGPISKRLIATFTSHAELFEWLDLEAKKRGYGKKRTVFLADGSEHISGLQQKHLPLAEVCLDWIHITEKLWKQRRTVLSQMGLTLLRKYWMTNKVRGPLLFPGKIPGRAVTREAFNKALGIAAAEAKVDKRHAKCVTRSRLTYWRLARILERCRSCSGTLRSARPSGICT